LASSASGADFKAGSEIGRRARERRRAVELNTVAKRGKT